MNIHFNYPTSLGTERIVINDKIWVKVELFRKNNYNYYMTTLNINGRTMCLGKYDKEFDNIKAKYKNGKIMLYHSQLNNDNEQIIKVLSLFELIEESFYSCTEEEALNEFDKSLETSYLKNKDGFLYSSNLNDVRVKKLR